MTEIKQQKAESWTHLMELLYADSWVHELNRYRSPFAFRGVNDVSWPLKTSLIRLEGPIEQLERHLLRNFRKYAHSYVKERDSLWFWLTFAQHHGLPTRLLDWTYSPYVALHFATDNLRYYDRDGVVWMADFVELHKFLPKILSEALALEGSNVFTTEMLTRFEKPEIEVSISYLVATANKKAGGTKTIRTLQDFDNLDTNVFLVFFEPPSIDDRVVNQFALFSVLSNPTLAVDQWLASHEEYVRKIIIPKELKPEVRDKLDQANITERVLFPGLDGLSNWLRRHYSTYPNTYPPLQPTCPVHTNLIAKDWKRLSAFYQVVFGCVPVPPERDLSGEWLDKATGLSGSHISGIHLRLPSYGDDGPTLELFQYDIMPEHPTVNPNTPGFSHIAFVVDDVPSTVQAVFDNGGSAVGELTVRDVPGMGLLIFRYVADPEGNIIEVQNCKKSHS